MSLQTKERLKFYLCVSFLENKEQATRNREKK